MAMLFLNYVSCFVVRAERIQIQSMYSGYSSTTLANGPQKFNNTRAILERTRAYLHSHFASFTIHYVCTYIKQITVIFLFAHKKCPVCVSVYVCGTKQLRVAKKKNARK